MRCTSDDSTKASQASNRAPGAQIVEIKWIARWISTPPDVHRHRYPYNEGMNQQLLIGIGVGLIVGGTGGYFLGSYQAMQSINKQTAEQEGIQGEVTVNPLENVTTNPLEDVKTNPYKNVKTNPFD